MLMYPRKGLITDPYNPEGIIIQDDQYPPDFYSENALHYDQSRLQSPFQCHPSVQLSPPSSAPPSPTFSSPTFSTSYPQTSDCQSFGAPSMTPASSYNPSYDIQGSNSPSHYLSQYPQQYYTPMLVQQPLASNQGWDSNLQLLSPARIPYPGVQKRSSPSASSRSAHAGLPANNYHRRSNSANKPLPTPVQTPLQNSFLATPFQSFDPSSQDGHNAEAESAMRKAIMDQQKQSPQQMQNDYSLAPSASSMSHNSPVTPQTTLDELDDASKSMTNEYNANGAMSIRVPKLNRTISDIYQDELYNPAIMAAPQMSKPMGQNHLNPRNFIADRLQAANQGHLSARSQSPGGRRDRSPFRTSSPFAGDMSNNALQQPQMATSVPMGQNAMNGLNGMNMDQTTTGDIKTMSPKDAVLDFQDNDDSMPPLFPPGQADFNLGDALGLRRDTGPMRPMEAFPQYSTPSMAQPQFAFSEPQMHRPQNLLPQGTDFPSLPAVESTESSPPSQMNMSITESIPRPDNTSSDAGTYTCTYHNCTDRFDSPSRLQRHKREAHRQTTPGGHLVSRDTSLRNSQAGPHKCERINPSTGKACNSIFSRPYDLTRHEHTIHTAGKQKVRCHICNEDKTFSRNDALTRHMRVVHPEIDWPGKQRRRRD
ncbi:transcriptional regulator family: C2H2 zinc finger [Penicillium roqueforti]|nr:transcriptional regulator family: C2H2 zinc finger [Penicillium roqueforti]KAI2759172.1 transcriptional regulator family: C2H2 zinc finger [Penicillium roqueforti]KAI3257545.1 transcriptional regulator family: C2H2 zinc finger [Penicillium roqueforti]